MSSLPPTGPYNTGDYEGEWQPYDVQNPQHQSYSDVSPPPPPAHRNNHPAAHPSSTFNALQSQRQYGIPQPQQPPSPTRASPPRAIISQRHSIARKAVSPPPAQPESQYVQGLILPYTSTRISHDQPREQRHSYISQGQDDISRAAVGGGVAGAAYGVADNHPREGGVQALRDIDSLYGPGHMGQPDPVSRDVTPYEDAYEHQYEAPRQRQPIQSYDSSSSVVPLAAAAHAPGHATPQSFASVPGSRPQDASGRPLNSYNNPSRGHLPVPMAAGAPALPPGPQSQQSWYDSNNHTNNPYDAHSISRPPAGFNENFDPNSIADDGDDGLEYYGTQAKRRSMLSFGRNGDSRSTLGNAAAAGAAGGGAGAPAAMALPHHQNGGGFFGGNPGSRDASGTYAPVPGGAASGASGPASSFDAAVEKGQDSAWLAKQTGGNKRLKWIVGSIIVVIVIAAIVGGVVGGVLGSRKSSSSSSGGESAAQDDGSGLLDKNSAEIQSLMNNKDLHRVFPGIDYTPINTQYPDCLTNPPSQNNVTRDMAVLSQLTNTLRLYGTDCNQTEMALYAIDALDLTDMKLWLGVWLGNNGTTNTRQLSTAWDILDKHGADPFAGVAVGNEVLFREDLTAAELIANLTEFKSNLTAKSIDLPVGTSDLGSNWNAQLAEAVDVVMANVHPFFAGTPVDEAASWTYSFWQSNDVAVSDTASGQKNIISEVGWPSGGGNDCSSGVTCPNSTAGSVAGIDEMNQFMADWVCQSLANGTDYFWFEAFDEPWKITYNDPSKGQNWEDKWGLMDVDRNLKSGVSIPDCGGKTVSRR